MSQLTIKFANLLMRNGQKTKAQRLLSEAFLIFLRITLEQKQETDYKETTLLPPKKHHRMLSALVENIRPSLEVRKVRVAKATHLVPKGIPRKRGETIALKWLVESANKRRQREKISFPRSLALEMQDAYHKQGTPRERRGELHRLAESNRLNVRYRWW